MTGKASEANKPAPPVPDLTGQVVGFAGLGLMGKGMARRLARAGAEVHIWNRSQPAIDELAPEGLQPHETPQALAAAVGASPIVVMVADTQAVESVLFGIGGLASGLAQGALVIDMGTTAVLPTRDFAERILSLGGDYVDAPVSGGQLAADSGTLTIMAGGSDDGFARARPLFQAMGRNITHLGAAGAGQIAKVANQVIVALTIDAVAEAFTIAETAGVDPAALREALLGGFAASRILDLHGDRMAKGNFVPGGRARLQRKDVAQALDLASALGLDLPALKLNLGLWDRLIARGDGDLDHSALIRIYRQPEQD